jgi:predicted TIM-barrel fold metal-dependent hydrolase
MAIRDPELQRACYTAYNDWLSEFCSNDPQRLYGVAMLPPDDPAGAIEEITRLARDGRIRQVCMHLGRVNPPIYDDAWEPFWSTAEETGTIVSFHIFVGPLFGNTAASTFTSGMIDQFFSPLSGILLNGVLDRHPNVKVVLAESGAGWIPWAVQHADRRYESLLENADYWSRRGGIALTMKPSEVFRRNFWITFQDDEVGVRLRDFFGPERILWASDYPHFASTWPNSREVIAREMRDLSPGEIRQITRDNALALYGLQELEVAAAPVAS